MGRFLLPAQHAGGSPREFPRQRPLPPEARSQGREEEQVRSEGVPGEEPSPLNRSLAELVLCSFTLFCSPEFIRPQVAVNSNRNECAQRKGQFPLARASIATTFFSIFDVFRF